MPWQIVLLLRGPCWVRRATPYSPEDHRATVECPEERPLTTRSLLLTPFAAPFLSARTSRPVSQNSRSHRLYPLCRHRTEGNSTGEGSWGYGSKKLRVARRLAGPQCCRSSALRRSRQV